MPTSVCGHLRCQHAGEEQHLEAAAPMNPTHVNYVGAFPVSTGCFGGMLYDKEPLGIVLLVV